MYISFDKKIILNIDEIDAQHKKWVELYNEMYRVMEEDMAMDKQPQIHLLIKEMYDYTTEHFKYEEELLSRINYPKALEHRNSHKKMDDSIYQYYRSALDHDFVSGRNIFALLKEWIINHILTEDKEYADFIFENNIDLKQ